MGNSSAFGSLARKALVWIVVAVVAIMLLKVVVGVVLGFVSMIFGLALLAADRLRGALGRPPTVIYLLVALWFGLATGIVGRIRGSSFFIWFDRRRRRAGHRAVRRARLSLRARRAAPGSARAAARWSSCTTRCACAAGPTSTSPRSRSSRNRSPRRADRLSSAVPLAEKKELNEPMMRAVDAIMECLKAEGVDVVFGYPGGANLPTYDAFVDAGIRHILVRHEAGGGHAAEGYAKATRQGRRRVRDLGPGRDQHRHAADRRDDGLRPAGGLHRPGADRAARHRRLPGGRHVRHHDADRQALVRDPAPDGDPAGRARGVPHRPHRPPGPGADRHPAGPQPRRDRLPAGRRRAPARLPADRRRQLQADPARGEGARQRAPAGALRRRRRGQRRGARRS